MKKKILFACIALLLMAVFVLIPMPASKLYIRIYFDEIQGKNCALYYAVDDTNAFSQEQCISAEIDPDRKMVEFELEPSLEGRITGLRLDFPDTDQLVCVKSISVSSAGVIQKEYDPCDFFGEENVVYSNDIDAVSLVTVRARAYIQTLSGDPYVIFSGGLCRQILDCYSHFRLTRLAVCVFFAGCVLLAWTGIFGDKEEAAGRRKRRDTETSGGADAAVFCETGADQGT